MNRFESEMRCVREGVAKVLRGCVTMKAVAVPIEDAARAIGLSPSRFDRIVRKKEISVFWVDGICMVRVREIEDWASSRAVTLRLPRTRKKRGIRERGHEAP